MLAQDLANHRHTLVAVNTMCSPSPGPFSGKIPKGTPAQVPLCLRPSRGSSANRHPRAFRAVVPREWEHGSVDTHGMNERVNEPPTDLVMGGI